MHKTLVTVFVGSAILLSGCGDPQTATSETTQTFDANSQSTTSASSFTENNPATTLTQTASSSSSTSDTETTANVSPDSTDSQATLGTQQQPTKTLFNVGFDGQTGDVTAASIEDLFGYEIDYLSAPDSLRYENGYLKQSYEPSDVGSDRVGFPTSNLPGSNELYLTYDLYFEPGWEWVKGGKLPGLAGGTHPTGGNYADDGFTARLMWRADGELVVYAYHQDRPTQYGEDFSLSGRFEPGQWYRIVQRVKANTAGQKNGEVEVWINGDQRLLETGIQWQASGKPEVDVFLYSSFYGGATPDWAPTKTTYARFDNFAVTERAPISFTR